MTGRALFARIEKVQQTATEWLWSYDHERPNIGNGGITPAQKLKMTALNFFIALADTVQTRVCQRRRPHQMIARKLSENMCNLVAGTEFETVTLMLRS
jgi:hypothetical protein